MAAMLIRTNYIIAIPLVKLNIRLIVLKNGIAIVTLRFNGALL